MYNMVNMKLKIILYMVYKYKYAVDIYRLNVGVDDRWVEGGMEKSERYVNTNASW